MEKTNKEEKTKKSALPKQRLGELMRERNELIQQSQLYQQTLNSINALVEAQGILNTQAIQKEKTILETQNLLNIIVKEEKE